MSGEKKTLVMDLEETETMNNFVGEGHKKFNRTTGQSQIAVKAIFFFFRIIQQDIHSENINSAAPVLSPYF
jgi:hypothetical protein